MMQRKRIAGMAAVLAAGALLAGCGTQQATPQSVNWLKVNPATHTATLMLTAGLDAVNGWANFNGYANGQMAVNIPTGYKVTMIMQNNGGIPFEAGVYTVNNHVAFPGSANSVSSLVANSAAGVFPGQSEQFTFVASKPGRYEIENLLDRIDGQTNPENFGMWDWFNVVSSGTGGVTVES